MNWQVSLQVENIIWTAIIIIVLGAIQRFLLRFLHRRIHDPQQYHKIRRSSSIAFVVLAFLMIAALWADFGDNISTYFGILSAGIAVALKDFLINLAAWLFIFFRRPFDIGDRIEVSGVKGDVIDQRFFQFSLLELGNWVDSDQSTGRIIHVPNSRVFTDNICNYTTGFEYIWNEINVLLTFESDWRSAKDALQEIAERHSLHLTENVKRRIRASTKRYYIHFKHLTPIVYVDVKESGIQLSIRYLVEPHNRRGSSHVIWQDIMNYIEQHDQCELAYPTVRMYQS